MIGKAYLKSATAAIAAKGFWKTGLFPCNHHVFDEHDPGRISVQHHELFAWKPCAMYRNCRRTAYYQRHKSADPNQQSLRLPQQSTTIVVPPSDFSPDLVTFDRKQEQPTKHGHCWKGSAGVLTNSFYKNKIHEEQKRKDNRDQRKSSSKIRLQKRESRPGEGNVSFIRGERELKRVIVLKTPKIVRRRDLWKLTKKIQIVILSTCTVQGCILEKDAAKSGWNAQNATTGAMKTVQVQTTGKRFFGFSATLSKFSASLPWLQCLAKHICTSLLVNLFYYNTIINSFFFYSRGILMQ